MQQYSFGCKRLNNLLSSLLKDLPETLRGLYINSRPRLR